MKLPGRDLAKIGLPLQIGGVVIWAIAFGLHSRLFDGIGGATHVVGDALFFFQMLKQRCL